MIIYPTSESLEHHPVVPRDQWLIARTELLKEEKEFTRLREWKSVGDSTFAANTKGI
jgi:predicted dithiol-disulfide oxidoreductase (DUF899 family)